MPVKIWERSSDGSLSSSIATIRPAGLRGEEFRTEADALDREIDKVLDRAVELTSQANDAAAEKQTFVKRWAVGRALAESSLLRSENLDLQEHRSLWLAMARKCRLGVRADGRLGNRWRGLIPDRTSDPQRTDRDVFEVSRWLQEQDLESATTAFAGKFGNAQKLYCREALRPLKLRDALARWMMAQPPSRRSMLANNRRYMVILKALRARWPARGPGSAKRPVHYPDDELYKEVCKTLEPVVEELLGGLATQPNSDKAE